MSDFVYESLKQRKAEQNEIARRFFMYLDGFGLFKKYKCRLCGEEMSAPSPRLVARCHSHKHPEISEAYRTNGLYELWKEKRT